MRLADIQIIHRDQAVIALVSGEIDMSNANDLRAAILDATPNDAMGVLLDLSSVDYIDSAGIHLVYRLGENLRNRGQSLRIVIPPESAASDALRLAGVKRHVDVVAEVDEGLRGLAARTSDEE